LPLETILLDSFGNMQPWGLPAIGGGFRRNTAPKLDKRGGLDHKRARTRRECVRGLLPADV
ncbi:hypothetical protein M427DRAFT_53960, partial [Gonapodya prolifera JEL478]